MQTTGSESAMTEIALALAMGFFSLMVLTLISFGTPEGSTAKSRAVSVAPPANGEAAVSIESKSDDLVVILYQNDFLDAQKNPLSVSTIVAHPGRVTLAIDPAASLETVIEARGRLAHPDLVITELDSAWLTALSPNGGGQP